MKFVTHQCLKHYKSLGFTLVELLVSMAIAGIYWSV